MVWRKDDFLLDLGLAPQDHSSYKKQKIHIDKAEIDPRSMGGVAIISHCDISKDGLPENLEIKYWVVHPDGRYEQQYLVQMETEPINGTKVDVKSLWVLGREMNLGNTAGVNSIMEAVRQIHVGLRDTGWEVPNLARIFRDCKIENVIGEKLPLPGFSIERGLHFPITQTFNHEARGKGQRALILPVEAFLPLAGMRRNTLDTDHSYVGRDFLRARFSQDGERFEAVSEVTDEGKKKRFKHFKYKQHPVKDFEIDGKTSNPMVYAKWRTRKVKDPKNEREYNVIDLKQFRILSRSALDKGFKETMSALGVINRAHSDMLNSHDFPRFKDHLATFGWLEAANTSANPPDDKNGRFVITSIGGNNLREIIPGIGNDIGGNCKIAETQWVDPKTKEVKRLGVILDFGAYLMRTKGDWDMGHPDVVEDLKYCKHIFISHHHLDHLDGLIPYIRRGLIGKEHNLHMTPEVYEVLNDKLNKAGIKKDDKRRPTVNFLQGTGVMDIKDEESCRRMMVMYGVDAVPHSAKDTPFIAYGCNGKQILGSYQYLGDMRYDEDWLKLHDSPYWKPVEQMLAFDPELNPDHCIPTYTEIDGTSLKYEGQSVREREAKDNLVYILNNWFHDKHAGISVIGTNDGRRETMLEVANLTQRKITVFGAAVEFLFRIANKWGVNPYRLDRPEAAKEVLEQIAAGRTPEQVSPPSSAKYTGNADFLSWHAEKNGIEPTEIKSRASDAVESWFLDEKLGKILAVLSGSQGNPIEFESVTYKLSEGRSLFDADPNDKKTARPIDLKDWVIIFSQGAIPGNAEYQRNLIKRLASRGATVIQSVGDDIRIFNPGSTKDRIIRDLIKLGRLQKGQEADLEEPGGTLYIKNFSIHASGHGKRQDLKLWLHKLKSKLFGIHHTDDIQSVRVAYDTIEEEGKAHPGNIFQNGVHTQITTDNAFEIGQRMQSIIMTRLMSEDGKQYNQHMEATRIIVDDDRSPHHAMGLRGTIGGFRELAFGTEDYEDFRRREAARRKKREDKDLPRNTAPIPERVYDTPDRFVAPAWNPDHPALEHVG